MAGLITPFLLLFALAPSLIWLVFYLRKDAHPEPNRMIIKIFLAGMLITLPAIFIENFMEGFFNGLAISKTMALVLYFLLGIALVEELLKYVVVKVGVFRNPALDEPLDVMLYMIISALGFAAFENILLISKLSQVYPFSDLFLVNTIRFIEAIFLHALVSGLFGYFLALGFLKRRAAPLFFVVGLGIATILHGAFNFYIFTLGDKGLLYLLLPIVPLLALGILVSFIFQRLKFNKHYAHVFTQNKKRASR